MDPFASRLTDTAQLAEIYAEPDARSWRKDIGSLDAMCLRLIAASPLVLIGSVGAGGACDVTPRGGPAGFVSVLESGDVAIPDATGNRRLDTSRNIIETGRAGLLFLIPGREWTLRVNGEACVTTAPEVLASLTPVGKAPRTAIVVRPAEVYTHCPKALIRSHLWDPSTWPDESTLPTPAEVYRAHTNPNLPLPEVESQLAESLRTRLA